MNKALELGLDLGMSKDLLVKFAWHPLIRLKANTIVRTALSEWLCSPIGSLRGLPCDACDGPLQGALLWHDDEASIQLQCAGARITIHPRISYRACRHLCLEFRHRKLTHLLRCSDRTGRAGMRDDTGIQWPSMVQ